MKPNKPFEPDASLIVPLIKAAIPEDDQAPAIELSGADVLVDDPFISKSLLVWRDRKWRLFEEKPVWIN